MLVLSSCAADEEQAGADGWLPVAVEPAALLATVKAPRGAWASAWRWCAGWSSCTAAAWWR